MSPTAPMNNKLELEGEFTLNLRCESHSGGHSLVNRVLELWRLSPLANVSRCAAK